MKLRQILAFTLITWLFVAPGLWKSGTNVVTDTYARASENFWAGTSVYAPPNGRGDWFKYSPLFAALYGPFALLPNPVQAVAWALLSLSVFWFGVSRWFTFHRASPGWMWLALALCAMEADISTRYQQVNALLTGLVLLALADARERRWDRAAVLLALGTNFKLLPGVVAAVLGYPVKKKYWVWFMSASAILLVPPALWLGVEGNASAHLEWLRTIGADFQAKGILDIGTVFTLLGWTEFGQAMRWTVLGLSLGILLWMRRPSAWADWGHWYTIAAASLLLFSPRTESPTFVLLAPAYLFLMRDALHQRGQARWMGIAVVLIGAFFITFAFSDLWPKVLWDPRAWGHTSKTGGTLWLWIWSFARVVKRS